MARATSSASLAASALLRRTVWLTSTPIVQVRGLGRRKRLRTYLWVFMRLSTVSRLADVMALRSHAHEEANDSVGRDHRHWVTRGGRGRGAGFGGGQLPQRAVGPRYRDGREDGGGGGGRRPKPRRPR